MLRKNLHKKENTKIIEFKVGTAIFVTVLTLMLAGCNKGVENTVNEPLDTNENTESEVTNAEVDETLDIHKDGEYTLYVKLEGGSGRTTLSSPTKAIVSNDEITVTLEWSSENYDYMIVDGTKYLPVNDSGNSTFEIPLRELEGKINVIADTVAMSKPHEIEYSIIFSLDNDFEEANNTDNGNKDLNSTEIDPKISAFLKDKQVTNKLERKYAEKFVVVYYDDKYKILVINDTDYYLLASDRDEIPNDLPDSITVINTPVSNLNIVSKSTMDYFSCLEVLDTVKFTSFKPDETDNEKLREMLTSSKIKYAGKYSAPDYELLLSEGCSLVIENTMIGHSPDVLEKLNKLGIKTLVDYSSHEPSPLGRMEWIKLYGLLTGSEEKADKIFAEKENKLNDVINNGQGTEKKVAYFYVSNNGGIVIRKNQDYIVKLIEMAGGKYAFTGLSEYDGTGQMTIQKEAFFEATSDCDILIYNSTINGGINSIEELDRKCGVLKNTKAYKDKNIYCTNDNIYMSVMELPDIAMETCDAISGTLYDGLTNNEAPEFLYKIE